MKKIEKKIFPNQDIKPSAVLYRKEDIEKIFDREKLLIGEADAVPEYIALEIFGEDAVEFAKRLDKYGMNANGYGIGDHTLFYLTLKGMKTAATYVNVCTIRDMKGGAAV